MKRLTLLIFFLSLVASGSSLVWGQTQLSSVEVVSGLDRPVWAGSPPGDSRIFVVEVHSGRILIVDNGAVLPTPFLDISSKINTQFSERGLLSMAFDPDYTSNGFFYVNYTADPDGAIVVERYQVSADPNVGDPTTATLLLGPVDHPALNHNGGTVAFGNDGYLYVSIGDGDAPTCNGLDGSLLLGKILRIDPDAGGAPAPGNPFLGNPDFDDRIWAYGLRNPWRFSFDPANGDLYIADVGDAQREEVNWVPGTSVGGENYGWDVMEGTRCTGHQPCPGVPAPPCNDPSLVIPVAEYDHDSGCSVSGGVVYRGCAIPDLRGTYFYSDWCTSPIWTFEMDNGVATNHQDRTAEVGAGVWGLASFGVDGEGEILIVGHGSGSIWKIVPANPNVERWLDEGCALAGVAGDPSLVGSGDLSPGSANSLNLSDAAPSATAALFIALSSSPFPFKGGVLKPFPFFPPPLFQTNGSGELALPFLMPGDVPGCTELWLQWAILDGAAVQGVALSNALLGITP